MTTSSPAPRTLIDLRQVVKVYETPAGRFMALKNVDLQVNAGEFVAVIGKSGSGKSTLINMITGIDRPSLGEVIVGGNPIHDLTEDQIAVWRGLNLGVIFQFFQLLPTLTVLENVMLPMELRRTYALSERKERAYHLLEQVELADQASKFPSAISGGQQQRVAIARALSNNPDILVGDEPTGSLDSKTADSIFRLFEEFVAQGRTILLVTHDRELAGRVPRVVFIADGEITDQHVARALPQLAREELAQVASKLEPLKFEPGAVIVRQGDPADSFYIIVKGEVDVFLQHASGAEVAAGHLRAGQYFGEIGLLEGGSRTATVRAGLDTDVVVMQLDRENFANLMSRSDMTREEIIHLMRQRVMQQYLSETLPVLLPDQMDKILSEVEIVEFKPGAVILEPGTAPGSIYIVVQGHVEVIDTQGQALKQLEQGQAFGQMDIHRGQKAARGIRAAEASKVMLLTYDLLQQYSPDLAEEKMSQMLTRRYLETAIGDFMPGLQRRKRSVKSVLDDLE